MKTSLKIRQLMDARGLTQTKVSEDTGLAPGTVSRLYRDQLNRIDFETLEKLATYFDCKSMSELVDFVF